MPRAPQQPGRRLWRRGALVDEAHVIVLLGAACTAGGGHQVPATPDAPASDTAAPDYPGVVATTVASPEHTCADVPWKSVALGPDVACGIHDDGCIECWGDRYWAAYGGADLYDEPDFAADTMAMVRENSYDGEAPVAAFACAVSLSGELGCWGRERSAWEELPREGAASVVVGERYDLGVLYADGTLRTMFRDTVYPPETRVSGRLAGAEFGWLASREGRMMAWDVYFDEMVSTDLAAAEDWRTYASCGGVVGVVRTDGSVAGVVPSSQPNWSEWAPPGSPWVAVWPEGLVVDATGMVYDIWGRSDGQGSGPVFTEPMRQAESKRSRTVGACGVTLDGRLECTGAFHDTYPPPGSYVVPD